jgi:hypothetical protein
MSEFKPPWKPQAKAYQTIRNFINGGETAAAAVI